MVFQKNCHHKSITRLRNDNIINLSDNTISISYTGHNHCYFSNNTHNINSLWGLADYDNPIIGLTIQESDQVSNNVLVMAHEITHLYGIQHHSSNGQLCIMEDGVNFSNIQHTVYSQYWCSSCLNTLRNNRNKY